MNTRLMISIVILAMLVAACATTSDDAAGIPLNSDPRVGDEVHQLCFTSTVRSWKNVDNDHNAVILVMNNGDSYKLKISSGCDPDFAMSTIALISRGGSSCYSRGDRIKTDAGTSRGYGSACTIMKINKWDPDAANPQQ